MLQNTDNTNIKTAVEIEVQQANAFEIRTEADTPINTTNNRRNEEISYAHACCIIWSALIFITIGITLIIIGKTMYYDPSYTCIPGYTLCGQDYHGYLCFNNNDTTLNARSIYDTISCGNFCSYKKNVIKPIVTENPFRGTGIAFIAVGSILLIFGMGIGSG